ncbi:quinone oxidoreductase, YhdH/YhfP family [Gluconacetobacter diazotrophicus PA1 5]|uniref:Putative zinc-containing alcohol dehydrogenase superfamily n=1 Tax=Gluconacetobacter diazotrophicus (strain ATCC 49037 / DSM 5601 / CCUG 37298 / CIP 103539 / LMG 7603 / PAl5) TaxID=272568 RepID=A9HNC6_GLUDA|nr:MDR family oxidoreductase [Gluconacetobacter diazotrophicus]ACI50518.1 quinone oxidoreductase, YhdH/YhfP family [Gluconacetobacter diazotrophicus PA1 5]TWB09350.1 acrylyl-CoA reductase (NADPH) [Gluconacetobacter diazotrophicus]CAP56425.1 putative zinc-containing alcohol dehydrogenase superfamily [Gluconacetobacter diazotrophicus PA1 5]
MFRAIIIDRDADGYRATLRTLEPARLPEGDVTVRVEYSAVNDKDALALTGRAPVVRRFPMVPGIDLAGVVAQSDHPGYRSGDRVVLNGCGVGESHWGGLSQLARVRGDWLVPLPRAFSTRQAMAIGTAGFTAMLCVLALERQGLTPHSGDVVVTGASGGVGGIAIVLLSRLGYRVVAVTGRTGDDAYLRALGADDVMDRAVLSHPGPPLAQARWAGAVDVAGGQVLASICAAMQYRGIVTACGLAGGMAFPVTVAPFILRSVTLVGIDGVMCPRPDRIEAWRRLAQDLDPAELEPMTQDITLSDVVPAATDLLEGRVRGRIVVAL